MPFLSSFFHLTQCFKISSMLYHEWLLHSFSMLNNISLCRYTVFLYPFICWWIFELLLYFVYYKQHCSKYLCTSCCVGKSFQFSWLWWNAKGFPKQWLHFKTLRARYEFSSFSISSSISTIVYIFYYTYSTGYKIFILLCFWYAFLCGINSLRIYSHSYRLPA